MIHDTYRFSLERLTRTEEAAKLDSDPRESLTPSEFGKTCQALLAGLGNYPPETVQLVTQEFGYLPGTTVEDLRTELANLRIDLGGLPKDWKPKTHSEQATVEMLREELDSLPATYEAMIERADWYLEVVPIDVGAKDFGMATLELLKLMEEDGQR